MGRSLRAALAAEQPPEAWVRDALAVARAAAPAPDPGPAGSWLRLVFPQVLGVTLLAGLAAALLVRPEVSEGLWRSLGAALPREGAGAGPALGRHLLELLYLSPLFALAGVEAVRAAVVRRREP